MIAVLTTVVWASIVLKVVEVGKILPSRWSLLLLPYYCLEFLGLLCWASFGSVMGEIGAEPVKWELGGVLVWV